MNFLIDDQSCDLLTGVAELQSGFLLIDRKAPAAKGYPAQGQQQNTV